MDEITRAIQHNLDAANHAARRAPLTRRRTRVLFLVHHIEAWDSLDGLVRAMRGEPDFEVVVASIPRRFRGDAGMTSEGRVHEELTARGVEHIRFTMPDDAARLRLVRSIDPDIIFRQSQWDADIPEAFSTSNLGFARLCLVPYETMNIVENLPLEETANSAVDLSFHRAAWMVFVTDIMKEMADRDGVRGGTQFVAVGHPKADRLRSVTPAWPIEHDDGERRGRVVWSAHHTIGRGWTDFGIAHLVAEDMLAWARERPDVDFVLAVHPALPPYLRSPECPVSIEEARRFLTRWQALPNAAYFSGSDYAPILKASDLMIVDGLSMLVEYQFMEKPLIHLKRAGHRPFNEVGQLVMSGAHSAPDLATARALAEGFLEGRTDPLAAAQRNNVRRLFGEEKAAPRILAALRGAIAAERSDLSV